MQWSTSGISWASDINIQAGKAEETFRLNSSTEILRVERQAHLWKSKKWASYLSQLNNRFNDPLVDFSSGAFGQSSALKMRPPTIDVPTIMFFIASALFPGTEKREFDYVCIIASFKSSTVLNCAKNWLRESLIPRQLRKMNNEEQRRKRHSQIHTYILLLYLFSIFKGRKSKRYLSAKSSI